MYALRKLRTPVQTNRSYIAAFFAMLTIIAVPPASQTAELLDRYYFTSDKQSLVTLHNAKISGLGGTLLELDGDGAASLISGTCTISTRSSSQKLRAGAHDISIPQATTVTIRKSSGVVISANECKPDFAVGIISGGSEVGKLHSGETYPHGETQLKPILTKGRNESPLYTVGNGELQLNESSEETVVLASGAEFFLPSRDLKIATPLGQVIAPPETAFLVSVSPGSVRVFNCLSKPIQFHRDRQFRKVTNAEEFCVFDHRPTKDEVLPADGVGRKEVTLHDLDKERSTASTNKFSVVLLLKSSNFLGDWKRTSAQAKKVVSSLIKSAAAYGGANPNSDSFYRTPINPVNTNGRQ